MVSHWSLGFVFLQWVCAVVGFYPGVSLPCPVYTGSNSCAFPTQSATSSIWAKAGLGTYIPLIFLTFEQIA